MIPQPPATVTALRQAVAQIAPAALPAFTRELDHAADQARQGADLGPLQRFTSQWAAYVHIQRQPRLAGELRRWEAAATAGGGRRSGEEVSAAGHLELLGCGRAVRRSSARQPCRDHARGVKRV
ncbi:hypothetical protein [Streptomyces antarcticus]|uniref:hypothetical protein n=1 Tax=Streptomyces antarcticus TaxID=2996458 RepID=UPI003B8310B2